MTVSDEGPSPTRPVRYRSPLRQAQARATRRLIVSTAGRLFAEHGYGRTTMQAVARESGVAVESVYALAGKAKLLLLAVDHAVVGDDEPVPYAERPDVARIAALTDQREQVHAAARVAAPTLIRLAGIVRAFDQAAATDPALAGHWREYNDRRRRDAAVFVLALRANGPLRDGLTVERATDTVWALASWDPVWSLVHGCGWDEEQVVDWLAHAYGTLLPPRR